MTGYTVHTGSTVKYSAGWDNIFGGKPKAASKKKPAKATASANKKTPARTKKSR